MKKTRLILGTFSGLPLGTEDDVFENAYQQSYKPFLKLLYRHPPIKATLHYTGIVLK